MLDLEKMTRVADQHAEDIREWIGEDGEVGSSDVSCWTQSIMQDLGYDKSDTEYWGVYGIMRQALQNRL